MEFIMYLGDHKSVSPCYNVTHEVKNEILSKLSKNGVLVFWSNDVYKLKTPYDVSSDDDDTWITTSEYMYFVRLEDCSVTLDDYNREWADKLFYPILTSEEDILGLKSKKELFEVKVDDIKIDFSKYNTIAFAKPESIQADVLKSLYAHDGFTDHKYFTKKYDELFEELCIYKYKYQF